MNKWLLATRPWSFPASVMPALVAMSYVFYRNDIFVQPDWIAGIASLIGAVLFHCAGNLISDYYDYQYGVDSHDNIGQTNMMIVDGLMKPSTILIYGLVMLGIGAIIGIWITLRCGLPILYMGLIGFILTLFYYKFKYSALGDLNICVTFGMLISLGTVYAMTRTLFPLIFLICLSSGFLIIAILHANNTRDRHTDSVAGIRTFAMILGLNGSKIYYTLLLVLAYLLILIDVFLKILPIWSLMIFLSFPMALHNISCIVKSKDMTEIAVLDGQTAKLVMIFSLLVVISCIVA